MHGLTIDEPGSVDSQMQQVQQELESSRTRISTLEKELADRDKRVERLETEARSQRKRWLDESRAQSQVMNTLRAELEAKANNIAYLTTELHRLKQKNRSQEQSDQTGGAGGEVRKPSHRTEPGVPSQPGYLHPDSGSKKSHPQHFVPAPPPQREKTLGPGSAMSRIRRSGSHTRSLAGGSAGNPSNIVMATGKGIGHPASADAHLTGRQHNNTNNLNSAGGAVSATAISNNPNHQLRLSSGRSSGSDSPDITPFLPPASKEDVLIQDLAGKQAPVLPPIPVGGSSSPRDPIAEIGGHNQIHGYQGGHHPVLVHKVVSSTSQHRQLKAGGAVSSTSKAEAALVTLAVENAAAPPDTAWALAHESRGSEYN
ncbi:coiled-coil domain-containing protein 92 [Elysia marginata]|uniref:Coiled-coil domain-containing protein 92 n=1 Tax=Elysia marginata TaxID=1093978 RepID=A0AAV4JLZ5_9GAST|nr:coiled-coil domain-containing protein 92 [Elysia marginata]